MCEIEDKAKLTGSCHKLVSGIDTCPICGHVMCPICKRHTVTQLSRVTGYVSDVSGWNAGKRQEFIDRKRYSI